MFSIKLAQTLQSSSRLLRAVSIPESRALFASKAAGSPSGESGRDVRDVGTQKVNVPVGEATKKADKLGGKGAGAVSQRGHEEVSGGQQQSGTNMQQKRSFTMSAAANKDKSPQNISKGSESESFISQEAKKNINPGTHSEKQSGGFQNLDFYPEKSGVDPFSAANRQQGNKQSSGNQYESHRNPSQTGRQAEDRYMDEAMSSKPGPLVDGPSDKSTQKGSSSFQSGGQQSQQSGQSPQQGGPGKGWKDTGSQSGKRSFSTSTASWTVTPAGKGTSPTGGQPAGQGTTKPTGSGGDLKGTERQRTGDDKQGKDNKKTTPPSIDVGLGEINTGKGQSQTAGAGGKRGMATSASSSGGKTSGGKREGAGPGTKKAESIGNAEFGGEDHKGGDRRAQHAEFDSQEQRVETDNDLRKAPSIHGAMDAVKDAVTGAAGAVKGAAAGAKDAMAGAKDAMAGAKQQATGGAASKSKNK